MKIRKSLVGLGITGGLVISSVAAFAQMPSGYPGMPAGGYPGMASGGSGMMGAATIPGGAAAGGGAESAAVTTTTTTTSDTPGGLPKTGGDPLSLAAAGSLMLSGGYALRRRFRGA